MITDVGAISRPFISTDELLDMGYLQEANRLFFHPLGLSLAAGVGRDGSLEIVGVFDCRSDPEGVAYAPDTKRWSAVRRERARRIRALRRRRAQERRARAGFVVQPVSTL